jgi:hypothetical protein
MWGWESTSGRLLRTSLRRSKVENCNIVSNWIGIARAVRVHDNIQLRDKHL